MCRLLSRKKNSGKSLLFGPAPRLAQWIWQDCQTASLEPRLKTYARHAVKPKPETTRISTPDGCMLEGDFNIGWIVFNTGWTAFNTG